MATNTVGIKITAQDNTAGAVRSAQAGLQSLQGAAGGVNRALASIGVGLSVGAFVAYTKSIIDGIDALNDLKDATGASIENISALEDVARRSGASLDTVGTSLVKLNQALNAAKPGSTTEAAVKAIGLSVNELKALDPAEAFRRIAVGLEGFADDANKARLTQELFGKSLKEVAPLLKDLAAQGTLNATVTTAQAEAAEKFNKELFALQKDIADAARMLTGPMVSAINETMEKFREGAKEGRGFYSVIVGEQLRFLGLNDGVKEYAERLTAISEKLQENNLHTTRRASLLREQAALQEKLNKSIKPDMEGDAQSRRMARPDAPKPKLPDVSGGTAKPGISAAQKLINDGLALYNDLMSEASGYSKTYTEDVTKLAAAYQATSMTAAQYTTALAAINAAQPGAVQAEKDRLDAAKLNNQAVDELFDAQEKLRLANEDQIKTGRTMLEQIEYETRLLGLSAEQRAMATLERELETQGIVKGTQAYDAYIVKLREATAIKAAKEVGIESTNELAQANKKAAEESSKYWEDALMRAFESGKGFFESLWSTIKNTLQTQVLKVLVSGTMTGIGGLVNATTGTSAGISLMGGVNGASSAYNLSGMFGGYSSGVNTLAGWAGYGASAGAGFGTLGYANAVGAMGGDGLGALIASNGSWAGTSVAATEAMWASAAAIETNAAILMEAGMTAGEAAAAATAAAEAGAAGSGSGALAGAGPYGWIAAAVIAAWAYASQQGETRMGGQYAYSQGDVNRLSGPSGGGIAGTEIVVAGAVAGINGLLKTLGSATYVTGFQAGIETSNNDRGGVFAGGTLSSGATFGESGQGDNYAGTLYDKSYGFELNQGEAQKYLTQDLGAATIEALQAATDLPATIAAMVKGFETKLINPTQETIAAKGTEITALLTDINAVVTGVNAFRSSLQTLPFRELDGLSFNAASSLLAVSAGARAVGETMDQYLGRGLQNLQASLNGFYESFYTSAEKNANLTRVVTDALKAQNIVLPAVNTELRAWYRSEVERLGAMDLSIEANARAYNGLLALQGSVDQLASSAEAAAQRLADATIGAQDAAMSEYMAAQADYADAVATTTENLAVAASSLNNALASAGQGIQAFIETLLNTPTNAAANYRRDLALARAGDVEASKRLPTSGRAYLDTQINGSATAVDAARATARMVAELQALPAVKSYEQQLLEAVNGTTAAVGQSTESIAAALNTKLTAELTVNARSEIIKLINFVSNADKLPDDLKELALKDAGTFAKTISFIQGSFLSPENMQLALMTETEVVKTYNFVAGSELTEDQKLQAFGVLTDADRTISVVTGSMLSDDAKQQAFDAVQDVTRTVKIVADSTSLAEYKQIALDVTADATKYIRLAATGFSSADAQVITAASSSVTKTVAVALGNNDPWALAVVAAQSSTIDKIIKASGGTLTDEQKLLLNGIVDYDKNIQLNVLVDRTQLTELQQQLMQAFGTYDISALASSGIDISSVISQGQQDRLESIAAAVNDRSQFDFGPENVAASTWKLYDVARHYGVTQEDLANAMPEFSLASIQALFDSYGIPRFAMGTNFLPSDMLAQVHQGERIIPAADNRELMSRLQDPQQNSVALVAEIKALRDDNAAQARAMVQLQQRLTKLMERWDANGLPTERLET